MREAEASAGLVAHCREAMRVGSLSFFLASRFLPRAARDAVLILYAWCRHCDDEIDGVPLAAPTEERMARLDELRRATWGAMRQQPEREPVFQALALLARRHALPDFYLQELLAGMEMDIEQRRYAALPELELYCYRVAGVVGLMFTHLIGVSSERALAHAASLGMAMQMTNIARDVLDDAALGRVYLPGAWLAEAGVEATPAAVAAPENRARVAAVVERLLAAADARYAAGDEGLRYLPVRAALAVAVARHTYAEIGAMVRARGTAAWDRRCVVPFSRKLVMVQRAARQVARGLFRRRAAVWRPAPITQLWRFP